MRKDESPAPAQIVAKVAVPPPAEFTQLVALFNAGQVAELEARARLLLERYPDSGLAWKFWGVALQTLGRDSLPALTRATELLPTDAEAHSSLGSTLFMLGRRDEAVASFRRALQIKPKFAEALYNLSCVLAEQGQVEEAEATVRQALQLRADFVEAHCQLSLVLRRRGRLEDARASALRAVKLRDGYFEGHYNLGVTLRELQRPDEALESFLRAVAINPSSSLAHSGLGSTLLDLGRLAEAERCLRTAIQRQPDLSQAHADLGMTLHGADRIDEAEASLQRALQIEPDLAGAHYNLATLLMNVGRMGQAEACFNRALHIDPNYALAYSNLGYALKSQGRLQEAEASYKRALEIRPDYADAYSNLLFLWAYCGIVPQHEYFALARNWEKNIVPQAVRDSARARRFSTLTRRGRRLRVGYVSGDLRQHAVSFYVESLFRFHQRDRFEVFAYPTSATRDQVSERLAGLVEHWVPLVGLGDDAACLRVQADEIDVLIDLSGHTMYSRLGVFARRAAPVQAHYLGYFASTGLTEMDYWIGDPILLPESDDPYYCETIWRLPRTWVSYQGREDAPVTQWLPAQDGTLWLGSFNNLSKITADTVALWSRILLVLPEAKLLLKTKELDDPHNEQRMHAAFAAYGIAPDRLELMGSTPDWKSHMALYDRLDIALDPVKGLSGGTTTCDALWMGVPVITMAGNWMGQRMTASMLESIGQPEWIAQNDDEYVDKVLELGRDVARRRALRFGQRQRMLDSALCDGAGLVRSLEDAYEEMFDRWWKKACLADGTRV